VLAWRSELYRSLAEIPRRIFPTNNSPERVWRPTDLPRYTVWYLVKIL